MLILCVLILKQSQLNFKCKCNKENFLNIYKILDALKFYILLCGDIQFICKYK